MSSIADELNVKEVLIRADEQELVYWSQAEFKSLVKYGKWELAAIALGGEEINVC